MTSLYELTTDYEEKLFNLGELIAEGNEVAVEDSTSILDLQDDIEAKLINIGKYVKNLEASSAAIKTEMDRLGQRKKSLDNTVRYLKASAVHAMQLLNVEKISDDIMPVRLQNNSAYSVEVEDPDSLPKKYQILDIKADKKALLADRETLDIEGVTITKGKHVRFG